MAAEEKQAVFSLSTFEERVPLRILHPNGQTELIYVTKADHDRATRGKLGFELAIQ